MNRASFLPRAVCVGTGIVYRTVVCRCCSVQRTLSRKVLLENLRAAIIFPCSDSASCLIICLVAKKNRRRRPPCRQPQSFDRKTPKQRLSNCGIPSRIKKSGTCDGYDDYPMSSIQFNSIQWFCCKEDSTIPLVSVPCIFRSGTTVHCKRSMGTMIFPTGCL